MNKYNDKRAFVEAALIAAMATIFAFSINFIPILSISIILIPVPFLILAYRHGNKYSVLAFITFSLLTGILTDIVNTALLITIFGPMTIAMGHFIKRRTEPFIIIGAGTIASMISIFAVFQFISFIGNINIIDNLANIMEGIVNNQVEMLKTMNVDVLSADEVINYMLMILPGVLIIQSVLAAFGNLYLTTNILKRLSTDDFHLPSFSEFRLPSNIVAGSFIIFALSYLTRYLNGVYHVSLITNVILLFVFLFFIQGIATISFFIKRTSIPKTIRIILIGIILIASPLLTAISFIGLMDSVVDIRKVRQR